MKPEYKELESTLRATESRLARRLGKIEHNLRHDQVPLQQDFAEQATATENDDVLQALGSTGIDDLKDIRAALARFESGDYGTCLACAREIPLARLKIVPQAARCVRCEEAANK